MLKSPSDDTNDKEADSIYSKESGDSQLRSEVMENKNIQSESNDKVADSAYANSCSNSQSRKSDSTKSTNSESNSSRSSGYGGEPSTSGGSKTKSQSSENRIKDKKGKKKVLNKIDILVSERGNSAEKSLGNIKKDNENKSPDVAMGYVTSHSHSNFLREQINSNHINALNQNYIAKDEEGFSCVISMHDGVVMYTTPNLINCLGFSKEMWTGRSFIDFIHPKDRNIFASQITNGLVCPTYITSLEEKAHYHNNHVSKTFCRIRKYRGLSTSGFAVRDQEVAFMPFLLKLSFKDVIDVNNKSTYLVIQAIPYISAFKTPNEVLSKSAEFVIRHVANGNFDYLDPASLPYLGYLPQDVADQCVLQLYHPEDLSYLKKIYELIVREGGAPRTKSYRIMAHNGDYLKIETEWSSFINPWSKKLEFVICKHHVIQGPNNPNVFQAPSTDKSIPNPISDELRKRAVVLRENIIRIMKDVLTKPAELAKQQMSKRCQDLANFVDSLMEEQTKADYKFKKNIYDQDYSYYEHDSVMLGGLSPHRDYNESTTSSDTSLSYKQLNYNENLERYFNLYEPSNCNDKLEQILSSLRYDEELRSKTSKIISPISNASDDLGDMTSSGESGAIVVANSSTDEGSVYYNPVRLSEWLLERHNNEMEKELVRKHKEAKSFIRAEKNKKTQRERDLCARNNKFNRTPGIKRGSRHFECEVQRKKHHKQYRHRHSSNQKQSRHYNHSSNPRSRYPVYYAPTPNPMGVQYSQNMQHSVPYLMYPTHMVGPPLFYSPIGPQMSYAPQFAAPPPHTQDSLNRPSPSNAMDLTWSNYEKVCKSNFFVRNNKVSQPQGHSSNALRERKARIASQTSTSKVEANTSKTTNALSRSTEIVPDNYINENDINIDVPMIGVEITDSESSFSTFYSSMFNPPDSGSGRDSKRMKMRKEIHKNWDQHSRSKRAFVSKNSDDTNTSSEKNNLKKIIKRKIDPPWMDQVCTTSDLVYKYQLKNRNKGDILNADMEKIILQPSLVNEQLGQLYLDMQLAGQTEKLTLYEGVTTSGSSGDEISNTKAKNDKKSKEFSKLSLIYQEDAPLPSPENK